MANKQVMDVSKPGQKAPGPSSRPVLLNHRPVLKDPMFNSSKSGKDDSGNKDSDESDQSKPKSENKAATSQGSTVQPAHPDVKPEESAQESKQPDDEGSAPQSEGQDKNPAAETQETGQPPANQQQAKDNKQQSDIAQLVHDKTYFMPITQPPRRYGLFLWIVFIAILIALAGAAWFLVM